MDYELVPKLEPPDSPISQERLSPEFDLSSPENGGVNKWGGNYGVVDDCAKESIRKLCLVCGDVASGLHYGVASCEACKAFFKRTIQGSIEYTCPASSTCEITRSRRKACQACRFQKCLLMGMMREGVRPDRVRGGRQKYRRMENSPSVVIRTTKVRPKMNHHHHVRSQHHTYESPTSKFLSTLKSIEPDKILACVEDVNDELKFKRLLCDLTDKQLVAIIAWVKVVPGFSELRLADQMTLLRATWIDLVCLSMAYRSLPYDREIVYADDFRVSEGRSKLYEVPVLFDRFMRRLIIKMSEIKMNYEEFLFVKLIVLFNPDTEIESNVSIQQQRQNVLDLMVSYQSHHRHNCIPQRISQLLLLLPLLSQSSAQTQDLMLTLAMDSRLKMHKLLNEMLEYAAS